MPLLAGDIRFVRSVNMRDVPEGGGPPSAQFLTSGASNEIFPDISEDTRTSGRSEIYQIHSVLCNKDRDALLGGNVILAKPPADPNVHITLLSLRNPFATRADIARRIESGMAAASEWGGYLLENHYATMRSVQLLQRVGSAAPAPGKTYVLVWQEGQGGERRQRVRIKAVNTEIRIYSQIINGSLQDFEAQVSTCELFDALLYDFPGSPPRREFGRLPDATVVRETIYSGAGLFYGASYLKEAAQADDVWIKTRGIYSQVVPNSQSEVALVDQRPAARRTLLLQESPRRVEASVTPHTLRALIGEENAGLVYTFTCRPPPAPGTLLVDYWALGTRYTLQDEGGGKLGGSGAGSINYLTGSVQITLAAVPDILSSINLSWGQRTRFSDRSAQGGQVPPAAYSLYLQINEGARVVPGSVQIGFTDTTGTTRSAQDDGKGRIGGDMAGAIEYVSGALLLRPQHLPESGGQLHIEYQSETLVTQIFQNAPAPDAAGFVALQLDASPAPGSLQIEWRTARSSSISGGTRLSEASEQKLAADLQTQAIAWYLSQSGSSQEWKILRDDKSASGGSASFAASMAQSAESGSDGKIIITRRVGDDGAGGFFANMGTIDYASALVSLKMIEHGSTRLAWQSEHEKAQSFENHYSASANNASGGWSNSSNTGASSNHKGGNWGQSAVGEEMLAQSSIVARYRTGAGLPQDQTQNWPLPDIVFDLCPHTSERVLAGSVLFTWMGHDYSDFEGVLYRDATETDPGVQSGSIDYALGIARLHQWEQAPGATAQDFTLKSLWTQAGETSTASVFFCTEAAPLRAGPGGFTLSATDLQGNQLSANVDAHGNITGDHMWGHVEFARGQVQLQFGDFVDNDQLSEAQKQEWWYDAQEVGSVQPGKVWVPHPVDTASVRYNAVSTMYLPVDAALMGLDAAALPFDGRVPFARAGENCVIGASIEGAPFAPSLITYNTGHERLSWLQVLDAATGAPLHTGYTANLDAGTCTFTDISGYPAQIRVLARREQYRQIAEVRIDGSVKLTRSLGADFGVDAVFSTALRQGDRFARVLRLFTQKNWGGTTWGDATDPQQGAASASYNSAGHPPVVTNLGAISERWALRFRTNQVFDLIGQHLGQIASGSTNEDFAPMNPAANAPYFEISAAGWGGGWAPGNVLFLHTEGAQFPIACVRCVQPSSPAGLDDSALLVQRGDVDTPPGSNFP